MIVEHRDGEFLLVFFLTWINFVMMMVKELECVFGVYGFGL